MRLKLLAILFFFVLAGTAFCQAADNSTSMRQPSQLELFAIILILVLFASVPLLLNMYMAHKHLTEMHNNLSEFIDKHPNFDEDKLVQIMQDSIKADPSGAPGTARSVMALSVTLIVGICLFFLLVYPPLQNPSIAQNIKDVLLTLTGALTSIIGFYFGGKGAESGQSPARQPPANQPPTNPPPADRPPANRPPVSQPPVNQPPAKQPAITPQGSSSSGPMAGMYKIKANFSYLDNEMVAGNIQSLSEVPSDILAEWIKNGMVEPYKV